MPIAITCDFCGKRYAAKDELAGRTVSCAGCKAPIRVPVPNAMAVDDPLGTDPAMASAAWDTPEATKPNAWQSPAFVAMVIGGGLLLLIGLTVGFSLLLGKKAAQQIPVAGGAPPFGGNQQPGGGFPQGQPGQPAFNPNQQLPNAGQPDPNAGQPDPNAGMPGGAGVPQAIPGFGDPPDVPGVQPPRPEKKQTKPEPMKRAGPMFGQDQGGAVVDWGVKVDPPAEAFQIDITQPVNIRVPNKGTEGAVIYPDVPSPFLAIGNTASGREVWEIWDLRTRTKASTIKGKLPSDKAAMSPDGLFVAAHNGDSIQVWDVKANKPLGAFRCNVFLNVLAFPSAKRMVGSGEGDNLSIWSIPSGDPERDLQLPAWHQKESLAFSPGGNYLAVVADDNHERLVQFFSLETGMRVGVLPAPAPEHGHLDCQGLAFSPDGEELAGLFGAWDHSYLIVWELKDGSRVVEHEFQPQLKDKCKVDPWFKGRTLEWFPDKKRWLAYGKAIIDRQVGGPVWVMEDTPDRVPAAPRVVLDDQRIMVVATSKDQVSLEAYELPKDLIASAAEIVAAGGLEIDARLPKLTAADWSASRDFALAGSTAWKAQPDPAPTNAKRLLERPIVIKGGAGAIKSVMASRGNGATAVALVQGAQPAAAFPGARPKGKDANKAAEAPAWLQACDLAAGKQTTTTNLPYDADLMGVSPGGTQALVRMKEGENRLDIWSLADGGHHLGWRPYASEEANKQKITHANFVDDEHVYTINSDHKLALWKLPECRALYSIAGCTQVAVSPNGKYLAIHDGQSFRLFEARGGELCADLSVEGITQALAFHPDGQRVAIVGWRGADTWLTVRSMQDGEVSDQFPLPRATTSVGWTSSNHLLIENLWLVDVAHKMVVWRYDAPGCTHLGNAPDARQWFATSSQSGMQSMTLGAAELPDPNVVAKLANAKLEPEFLLQPGASISLVINVQGTPNRPTLAQDVRQQVEAALAKNNITVAANQPLTLQLSMTQGATGENLEFEVRQFGAGFNRQTVTVPGMKIDCKAQILQTATSVWEANWLASNNSFGFFLQLREGETVQTHLNNQMYDSAANFFLSFAPPSYVFTKQSTDGLGNSTLVAR